VSSVVSTLIIFGIIQGICVLENRGVDKNVRQGGAPPVDGMNFTTPPTFRNIWNMKHIVKPKATFL